MHANVESVRTQFIREVEILNISLNVSLPLEAPVHVDVIYCIISIRIRIFFGIQNVLFILLYQMLECNSSCNQLVRFENDIYSSSIV
jgi:hypothetical protein